MHDISPPQSVFVAQLTVPTALVGSCTPIAGSPWFLLIEAVGDEFTWKVGGTSDCSSFWVEGSVLPGQCAVTSYNGYGYGATVGLYAGEIVAGGGG